MAQPQSQIQIHKDLAIMSAKLDRLESEMALILKKLSKDDKSNLNKGLKELKEGRGRIYKSVKEWSAEMKAHK